MRLTTWSLALASYLTTALAGECGTGLISGGQNYKQGPSCYRTGTLWNCGDGTTVTIDNKGWITLRVWRTDSTIHTACSGGGAAYYCTAPNAVGKFFDGGCKNGWVTDVWSVIET